MDAESNLELNSKLDLWSAFNLVWMHEGDAWKKAFSSTSGHFEYCIMPHDLSSAPAVFQCFINDILRDMLGELFSALPTFIYDSSKVLAS